MKYKATVSLTRIRNLIIMQILHTDKKLIDKGDLCSNKKNKCIVLSLDAPSIDFVPNSSVSENLKYNYFISLWGREKKRNSQLTCATMESTEQAKKAFEIFLKTLWEFIYGKKRKDHITQTHVLIGDTKFITKFIEIEELWPREKNIKK